VTTIRPNLPPLPPGPAQKPADAGRLAAQKAFFAIAAGQAAAPAQAVQAARATAPAAAPAPVHRTPQAPAEAPVRPLRPGSLLDIRV
jgi:hypothetical protein